MTDLGTGPSSRAEAINNRGQVVGTACHDGVQETPCRGFLWQDGAITQLGTLGGTCSRAMDINNRGQVVGMSCTAADEAHAFLWRTA